MNKVFKTILTINFIISFFSYSASFTHERPSNNPQYKKKKLNTKNMLNQFFNTYNSEELNELISRDDFTDSARELLTDWESTNFIQKRLLNFMKNSELTNENLKKILDTLNFSYETSVIHSLTCESAYKKAEKTYKNIKKITNIINNKKSSKNNREIIKFINNNLKKLQQDQQKKIIYKIKKYVTDNDIKSSKIYLTILIFSFNIQDQHNFIFELIKNFNNDTYGYLNDFIITSKYINSDLQTFYEKIKLNNLKDFINYYNIIYDDIYSYSGHLVNENKISIITFAINYFEAIKNDEQKKDELINFWVTMLRDSNEDNAKFISTFISVAFNYLDLDYEDQLVQESIRTYIQTHDNKNNPYKIYNNIKAIKNSLVNMDILYYFKFIEGKNISINPYFLQWLSTNIIDEASAPKISSEQIKILFSNTKSKINSCPVLQKQVINITKESIENILNDSLLNHFIVILNLSNKNQNYRNLSLMLQCLINYYLNLSKDMEESFLKALVGIQDCPAGKNGGIIQAYEMLDSRDKLKNRENNQFEAIAQDKNLHIAHEACQFLYERIQDFIETMFVGDNKLMFDICKLSSKKKIKEAIHHGNHLRNLIGYMVGSRFDIVFDSNVTLVNKELLNLGKQDALNYFYKHINNDIENMINYIRIKINEELYSNKNFYNHLSNLVINNNSWEYDEKTYQFSGIKNQGVVEILIKIGMLVTK
jgi:hypothetical protein